MDDAYAPSQTTDGFLGEDLHKQATNANTFGLIATILAMLGPCSGYTTFVVALPMGLVAIHYGRTVLMADPDGEATAYARTGLTLGVLSAVYSAMWLMFVAAIFLLYGAMFAAIIAGNL